MRDTRFYCLPTIIGSMPHTDPLKACRAILKYLKDIPAWPQLPALSFREDMNVQFSEGFPGFMITPDKRYYVENSDAIHQPLEQLYADYIGENDKNYSISKSYASGMHALLSLNPSLPAIKGQITGPITWGISVTDQAKRPIIYDDLLGDAVPKFLRLKASNQEKALGRIAKNVIIFVDEPYMAAFGSSTWTISREKVINLINEVFQGIQGLKGIHCCGNTDWSVLLSTRVQIISYDAYNFGHSMALYIEDVRQYLDRGGAIAWGIIPNEENKLVKESVSTLKDRFEDLVSLFTRKGIPFQQILAQGMLTPSCGLAGLSEESSEVALKLLAELSNYLRRRYI